MRHRLPNEKAVSKLSQFLNALQLKCDDTDFTEYTTSQLHSAFNVNRSTYSVCKKLGIVKETKQGLEWVSENPNREMCLRIMAVLLEQSKKEIVTPITSEWLNITEALTNISEQLQISINQQKSVLNRPILPQVEKSLFSEQEKKEQIRHELIASIASGIYKNFDTLNDYQAVNHRIMTAADHLLSLYHKK